jgi:hypothetical protein
MICDSTTCKPSPSPAFSRLDDVFAVDEKTVFIVGQNGTIMY